MMCVFSDININTGCFCSSTATQSHCGLLCLAILRVQDGSSFYDINENVFFDADGFKMDYVSALSLLVMVVRVA